MLITLFVQLLLWSLLTLSTEFQISNLSGKKVHFQVTCCQYLNDKAEFKRGNFEKSLLLKNLKRWGSSCALAVGPITARKGQLGQVLLNHFTLVLKAQWTRQCQTQQCRTS